MGGEGYYGGAACGTEPSNAKAGPGYASEKISLTPSMVREMRGQRQRLVQRRLLISERVELLGQLLSLFEEV